MSVQVPVTVALPAGIENLPSETSDSGATSQPWNSQTPRASVKSEVSASAIVTVWPYL